MDFNQPGNNDLPPNFPEEPRQNAQSPIPPGPNCNPNNQAAALVPQATPNGMSIASMVLGIVSVAMMCLIYFSPIFAGLSILFAILSRGYEKKMYVFAKVGIITSVCAIIIETVMIASSFALVFSNPDAQKEFWKSYKQTGETLYGEDFDDMMKDFFGPDFDIDKKIKGGILWLEQ